MRGEQAGAGFRSLPRTSQWKAPLSPAASAGVSKGLSASRKPHPRESCASDITAGPRTGPAAALGQASEGDGGGGWFWVPGLGPRPGSRGGCRNQGATTPIQEHLCHLHPLTLPISFSLLRPSPIPALTGTQFRKRDETWEWWEAGSGEKQRLEAGGLF